MVDRSKLVPRLRPIKGKDKQFMAIRYVSAISPVELKKRTKEFIAEREKKSKYTHYLERHNKPEDVDVFFPEDLKASIPIHTTKTGEKVQYYSKFNVNLIKKAIEFKKPNEVFGAVRIVQLVSDISVVQYTDDTTQKRQVKKHKRSENTAEKIGPFLEKVNTWIKATGTGEKRQLTAVLMLMANYDVRVGSGVSIKEGPIGVEKMKSGMVIAHPSWKAETPPHMVIIKEGKIYLRNVDKAKENKEKIKELKEEENTPVNKEKIKRLQEATKQFPGDLNTPMPGIWKEVTRLGHYGATELQARHVKYPGPDRVKLEFIGKSNVFWKLEIKEPELKQAFRDLQKGKADDDPLFVDVKRRHVAKQLRKYKVLPKDFRSYNATKKFIEETKNYPIPATKSELNRIEKKIFDKVSMELYNTPGMAKKSYVSTNIYVAWRAGQLKKVEKGISKSFIYVILGDLE
jgi:DNA topoisomerase IB